ncbi:dipeptidyl aminopeptidase [Blastomyces dermatitidis ATCC 18188]|uniref:Dipeptidyl aminopeptidase n=1 Tax=Ajellomyces dermatitidis (strain ATCC 18188 / CBS 674.68) TaxID=653446 RepID=F2TBR2_AJEDA|nr:dipeptidyl aminopeptidase [Blastomyces dermatitidis ATCC 18188]
MPSQSTIEMCRIVLRGVAKNGGVVMVTFVPMFLDVENPSSADIHMAADHIFHVAEDISAYPQLAKVLLKREATDEQVQEFAGENISRAWSEVEDYSKILKSAMEKPNQATWLGRK